MIATRITARIPMMRNSIGPRCMIHLLAGAHLSLRPLPSALGWPPRNRRAAARTSPLAVAAMHDRRFGAARAAHSMPRREGKKE